MLDLHVKSNLFNSLLSYVAIKDQGNRHDIPLTTIPEYIPLVNEGAKGRECRRLERDD